jgi:hypothetical protein
MLRPGAARKLPLGRVGAAKSLILFARPERFERPTQIRSLHGELPPRAPDSRHQAARPSGVSDNKQLGWSFGRIRRERTLELDPTGTSFMHGLHCVRGLTIVSTRSLYVLEGKDLPSNQSPLIIFEIFAGERWR